MQIHQDATIYTSLLAPGDSVTHRLSPGRRAYVFVIKGDLLLNGKTFSAGDQARVTGERELQLSMAPGQGSTPADFLLLDLPSIPTGLRNPSGPIKTSFCHPELTRVFASG